MIEIIWNVSRERWDAYEAGVEKERYRLVSSEDQREVIDYVLMRWPTRKIVIRPKV